MLVCLSLLPFLSCAFGLSCVGLLCSCVCVALLCFHVCLSWLSDVTGCDCNGWFAARFVLCRACKSNVHVAKRQLEATSE